MACRRPEIGDELLRPSQLAGQPVADADRHGRWRRLVFPDDIEMRVERRDFVHLRLGKLQLGSQRGQMSNRQMTFRILYPVEMFYQQIRSSGRVTQQVLHLGQCSNIHLSTLRMGRCRVTTKSRMTQSDDLCLLFFCRHAGLGI